MTKTKPLVKPLRLTVQTLRNLQTTELAQAAGGFASGRRSCPDASCCKGCSDVQGA